MKAAPSNDNTSVFTGQFLPAFLGGAYDPTEAYKRIAGLPVYVFGYDRWSGTQAMVINNYAIRTQIRADGSFQVQGLPTAAHYAVYFPYKLSGSGVERADCIASPDPVNKPWLNPCFGDSSLTSEFRWPDDEDQIKDVFSYSQGDASAVTIGNTQVDGQQVKLGKVFLTNETRVDIVNHINVFPLVPKSTIKILLQDSPDFSYEVVAQRINYASKTSDYTHCNDDGSICDTNLPLNYPIIRGRTTPTTNFMNKETQVFQAYAPNGKYAITYWRTEAGSANYKDWDTKAPVNSSKNGFMLEKVVKDWRAILINDINDALLGYANSYGISLWGTVTNKEGFLMDGATPDLNPIHINVKSDVGSGDKYTGRSDKDDMNHYLGGLGGSLPTKTIWGIYVLGQTAWSSLPTTDSPWVYVDEHNNYYKTNPANPRQGIISSLDGPQRIDLVASKGTLPSGYDTGLVLNACFDAPCSDTYPNASARIATNLNGITVDIPALLKPYPADRLGQIYVPDIDLKRDQDYTVEIRAGNKFAYVNLHYPADGKPPQQSVQLDNATLAGYSESYKILGLIPVPFFKTVLAALDGLHGKVKLTIAKDIKLINPKIKVETSNSLASRLQPCLVKNGCGVFLNGSLSNDLPPGLESGGEFEIVVPQPPAPGATKEVCIDGVGCPQLRVDDQFKDTYRVTISGTLQQAGKEPQVLSYDYTFSVNSKDTFIPPFELTPTIDCSESFKITSPLDVGNFVGQVSCNMGVVLGKTIGGFLKFIYQEGLLMRPITETKAIVEMWGTVRGLANIFFVILLIIIGIATILRLEPKTYNLGILLPRLFINIALANFSLLIVQVLIDSANILTALFFGFMENILSLGGYPGGGAAIVSSLKTVAGAAFMTSLTTAFTTAIVVAISVTVASGGALGVALLTTLLSLILSLVIFIFGLFLLFLLRYVGVWVATVIAPLLFVLNVLPSKTLSGLSSLFWNTILPLIFMGPVMAFIFGIGMSVLTIGGSQNEILAGLGTFAMGLITLGMSLKVPEILSGLFKGGLMSAQFGGKEGTGGMAEGLVAGRLGAKDMDTLKKERLNAPAMEASAQRGSLEGGRLGALGGVFKGLTGRYATQDAERKQYEAAVKAGGAGRAKPWEKAKAEMTEDAGLAKAADVSPDQFKLLSGYFGNASRVDLDQGLYTGRKVPKLNAAGIPLITGEQEMERVTLDQFFKDNKVTINAKGEPDRVAAIEAFKKIKPKEGATTDQIEAQNLNMQKMRQFARVTKVPD